MVFLGVLAGTAGSGSRADDSTPAAGPRVRAVRTSQPPRIDGRLDEAIWESAAVIDRLVQVEPVEGGEPSEHTEARLLYDSEFLYLGLRAFDRQPEKLVIQKRARDEDPISDDRFALAFDTFHDRRNAFFLQINPAGARRDGLIEDNRTLRIEWDGIWYARTSVDALGWVAEIAIPFQTVGFDPEKTTWGFNLLRAVRRRNETNRWANAVQNRSFIDMANAGVIEGLEGLDQGLGLDVKPSLSLGYTRDRIGDRKFTDVDPGLDVFYKFAPFLTGVLTFNTDFSESSVDERQINLTRFGLFFPETRDFFLQDAGIFDFGGLEENGRPFFSRRIGILPSGDTVGLRAGAKLTGRTGPWNIGLLDVQMDHEGDLEAKNLAVARLAYNVLEESRIGLIASYGDPASNGSNFLVGGDFRYRNSHVFDGQVVEADVWFQKSSTSGVSDRQLAYGTLLSYPNDRLNASLGFLEIQDAFFPALGFVNRRGIRQYDGSFRRRWRPGGWLRTVDTGFVTQVITDRGNALESLLVQLDWITLTGDLGDTAGVRSEHREEQLAAPFEIFPGIVLPVRTYRFDRGVVFFATDESRPVNLGIEFGFGEFFSGKRYQTIVDFGWRPSPLLDVTVFYEENHVNLREGSFTTRIARLRVGLDFSTELSWETLIQYDNVSDTVGVNSRLRWIVDPGNEFFLVWNQGFDVRGSAFASTFGSVSTKLVWTFRF